MMTRLVSWLFFISLGIIGLLFVLPGTINWERHKDLLLADAASRIGQKVTVDGAVSLRLLPNPQILLEKVTVGEGDQYLLRLEKLEARLRLKSLLEGRYEIDSLSLIEPEINIVIARNGESNWSFPKEESTGKAGIIALKQVGVTHARLRYRDIESGQDFSIDKVNMTMEAGSLLGPYKLGGDFLYGDAPTNFTLNTGIYDASGKPFEFEFALQPIDNLPQATIKGSYVANGAVRLDLSASEGKLASLLSPLFPLWREIFSSSSVFAANSETKAVVERMDGLWRVSSFSVAQGKSSVKGSIDITPEIKAVLEADNIDLGNAVTPPVPVSIALKGSNIRLAGRKFDALDIEANFTRPVQNQPQWQVSKAALTHKASSYVLSGNLDASGRNGSGAVSAMVADLSTLQKGLPSLAAKSAAQWKKVDGTLSFSEITLSLPQAVMFGEAGLTLSGTLQPSAQGLSYQLDGPAGLKISGLASAGEPFGADIAFNFLGGAVGGKISENNGLHVSLATPNIDSAKLLSFYGLDMQGITLGAGEARIEGVFDISAKSPAEAITGKAIITPANMRIENFNPAEMQKFLLAQTAVPDDLGGRLLEVLGKGSQAVAGTPLVVNLSPVAQLAPLEKIAYDGGVFGLKRSAKGVLAVEVAPSEGPAYGGALPLAELPVDQFATFIRQRHPGPTIETQDAVGSILKSLEEEEVVLPPAPAAPETMPPQPLPALPEIEVGLPPGLPPETEETQPFDYMPVEEILPAEQDMAPIDEPLPVPPPDIPPPDIPPP